MVTRSDRATPCAAANNAIAGIRKTSAAIARAAALINTRVAALGKVGFV